MSSTKSQIERAADRPLIPPAIVHNLPAELREYGQWIHWRYEKHGGRWTKVPLYTYGEAKVFYAKASSTDPSTWAGFDGVALHAALLEDTQKLGVGFVFSKADPFFFVDLDDCRDRRTGELTDLARRTVALFDTYTEVSISGTGLRIIGRGKKPGPRCTLSKLKVELFEHSKFTSLTGRCLPGTPADVRDCQAELDSFYSEMFPEPTPAQRPNPRLESTSGRPVSHNLNLTDAELIERAVNARNGEKFRRLWAGDWSAYGSQSDADLALAGALAFWTGNDAGRIDVLFRQSGLMRPKWERSSYRGPTISRAMRGEVYDPSRGGGKSVEAELAGIDLNSLAFTVGAKGHDGCSHPTVPLAAPVPLDDLSDLDQVAEVVTAARAAGRLPDPWAEEAAAAALIRAAEYDTERFPCVKLECLGFQKKDGTNTPVEIRKPCRNSAVCPGCRARAIEKDLALFQLRLSQAVRNGLCIYTRPVEAECWKSMRAQITRKRPAAEPDNYFRCPLSDGLRGCQVFTTSPRVGGELVTIERAVAVFRELANRHPGGGKFLTSSTPWAESKLPEPPPAQLELVSRLAMAPESALHEIADNTDAVVRKEIPSEAARRRPNATVATYVFERPDGWDQESLDYFWAQRSVGEALPRAWAHIMAEAKADRRRPKCEQPAGRGGVGLPAVRDRCVAASPTGSPECELLIDVSGF